MGKLALAAASIVSLFLFAPLQTAQAITLGQVDDFQDQTFQGWGVGAFTGPNPPLIAPICGPSGNCGPDLDHSLLLTSNGAPIAPGGAAAGRALVAGNSSQWAGDYIAMGINAISMDVNNLGFNDVELRLSIFSMDAMGGTFSLTTGIMVPTHGTGEAGWTNITFDLAASEWTSVVGPSMSFPGMDINTALSNVTALRIVASAAPDWRGDSIVAQLGVDNITAIPEPSTLGLVLGGLALLARVRRA